MGGRRRRRHIRLTLPLVAAVLKPYLDLGLAQLKSGRQPAAIDAGEVAADGERRLELEHLSTAEHRPRFLLPVAADVIVRRPTVGCCRCAVHVAVVVVVRIL